jgi:hypothetical protein
MMMKKTIKAKKLNLDKITVRMLSARDMQDVVGGTIGSGDISCFTNLCDDAPAEKITR